MPLIDVTFDETLSPADLRRLAELLPDVVSEAVDCNDEPWVGPPGAGDIEIRFHRKGPLDVGALNLVVEVRTKLFDSRLVDVQRRADLIRDRLSGLGLGVIWRLADPRRGRVEPKLTTDHAGSRPVAPGSTTG